MTKLFELELVCANNAVELQEEWNEWMKWDSTFLGSLILCKRFKLSKAVQCCDKELWRSLNVGDGGGLYETLLQVIHLFVLKAFELKKFH